MVYTTPAQEVPHTWTVGPPDMAKAPGTRGPRAFAAGRRARLGLCLRCDYAYAFVFSACIASISSSDSRPGVGMSNFVIAKRKTA